MPDLAAASSRDSFARLPGGAQCKVGRPQRNRKAHCAALRQPQTWVDPLRPDHLGADAASSSNFKSLSSSSSRPPLRCRVPDEMKFLAPLAIAALAGLVEASQQSADVFILQSMQSTAKPARLPKEVARHILLQRVRQMPQPASLCRCANS